jgi:hypothetical protein
MTPNDSLQFLISAHSGAAAVAQEALAQIISIAGVEAPAILEGMRMNLISRYKNSEIVPEREMDHVLIVQPAMDEIDRLISAALPT